MKRIALLLIMATGILASCVPSPPPKEVAPYLIQAPSGEYYAKEVWYVSRIPHIKNYYVLKDGEWIFIESEKGFENDNGISGTRVTIR
jgi:hypothetical protein